MKQHPLWSEAKLTKYLRECNAHFDGPGEYCVDARGVIMGDLEHAHDPIRHVEAIPGDGKPFDARAAARRLLAAWRDAPQAAQCSE